MRIILDELNEAIENEGKTSNDIAWLAIELDKKTSSGVFKDYNEFIELFEGLTYDSGYGSQNLFGVVVFNDNTWLEREEYDGSEWWSYKQTPKKENYE